MKYIKRLPLSNIKNARDLGGVPNLETNVTNWGKFLRSATLDDASDKDLKCLLDMGVESVIDLRREAEIAKDKESHKKVRESFSYHNVSLAGDRELRDEEIQSIINKELSIGATYRNLIDNYPAIKEIMEIFANTEGISLFHCQEGKDRTGIISMILLGLVDVSRSDIIADYEISSAYLGYVERYEENEPYSVFRITSPYYMREAYNYVLRKYGNFEKYLQYAKVSDEVIAKIKEKLIG